MSTLLLEQFSIEVESPVVAEGSPLQVNASRMFSCRRSQQVAVQQFRETGIAVESPSAANLQAILDYCFKGSRDFTLNWTAKTGAWTVFHEAKMAKSGLKWQAEGPLQKGQPGLLSTQIGIFRATLAHGPEGWRLQLCGTGESWALRSMDLRNAQAEAAWIIRQQMKQVLEMLGQPK